jgi:hypothetical protein
MPRLQSKIPLEKVIKGNHIEAYRIIAEKLARSAKKSSPRKKKKGPSLEQRIEAFCKLSPEEMRRIVELDGII